MKRWHAGVLGAWLVALAIMFLMTVGCGTAPPAPSDIFTDARIDCRPGDLQLQKASAMGQVEECLVGPSVDACLVSLVPAYSVHVVACAVRDRGSAARAATLIEGAPPAEETIARAAKAWITRKNLGYL